MTTDPNDKLAREYSRVDREVEELAESTPNPRVLSGKVAGTSEETAALFASHRSIDLIEEA